MPPPAAQSQQPVPRLFFDLFREGFIMFLLVAVLVSFCLVWFFVHFAELKIAADMVSMAQDRLTLYSGTLNSALSKYSYLPHIIATHPAVKRLVSEGDNLDAVNDYLKDINSASGSMVLFVLDRDGVCIATSNWDNNESFAGHDYNYRPYFQDAVKNKPGRYFGVGATTGKPGFFFTQKIEDNGHVLGVAVTKVDLSMLQREWGAGGETVFITDDHGVIFLSSRDDWRYRATEPLSQQAKEAMLYQRQYGSSLPPPIQFAIERENGVSLLLIGDSRWISTARPIEGYGWTIRFLIPLHTLKQQRETLRFIGFSMVLVFLLATLLVRTCLAWARAKRVAREAEKIREINTRLEKEVRIRKETERELLAAQDDLLHASRMAALGQVAASLAHELSQPVTSMRMFAASCRRFAQEGQFERITQTIGHMLALVDRIKALIDQLKYFSRKVPGKPGRISLKAALENMMSVLHFQQAKAGCAVRVTCPDDAVVLADALQLEQVCINLVHNALDAVSGLENAEERRVSVVVAVREDRVELCVADTGPGIDAKDLDKIFTPFFTTKKSGEGIGLGLAIVESIVQAMHGEITVSRNTPRGMRFTVSLPLVANDGSPQ